MKNKTHRVYDPRSYLFFLFWPFGTLLYSIKNYRSAIAPNFFWLFSIFMGFTFVLGGDSLRMTALLEEMHNSNAGISTLFQNYLSDDSGVLDLTVRIITYIVSLFTDDYRFLLASLGVLMGYFLSRIIWFLIYETKSRLSFFSLLLILSFSLTIGIWDIHGRWNIAAALFVLGFFNYLKNESLNSYLLILFTLFIHWSFSLAIAFFFIFRIVGHNTRFNYVFFVVSFVFIELDFQIFKSLFETYAPSFIQSSRSGYLNEGYVQHLQESALNLNWYIPAHLALLKYYIFITTSYFVFKHRRAISNLGQLNTILNFTLLFYAVFNILSSVPSMGRFITIGNILFLAFLFLSIAKFNLYLPKLLRVIGYIVLLLFIIVRLRIGFDYIGIWTIVGSPLFAIFLQNDLSLIEFVKYFA